MHVVPRGTVSLGYSGVIQGQTESRRPLRVESYQQKVAHPAEMTGQVGLDLT